MTANTLIEPVKPFNTVVVGETGVGKTYFHIQTAINYAKGVVGNGSHPRKGIILNFQNESEYDVFRTLEPTPEEIMKFVNQAKIEVRQIKAIDSNGNGINSAQKVEIMILISQYFRNGLVVYDDIDSYAAFSQDKDLIGSLMGNRHKGMDGIFAHQAWRKIGVTEVENLKCIRVHHTSDNPMAMPTAKRTAIEINLCMLAYYAVDTQYNLVTDMYYDGRIKTKKERDIAYSYYVNIDMREKKIWPISDHNFNIAVKRYATEYPALIKGEMTSMIFDNVMTHKQRNDSAMNQLAVKRLQAKFSRFLKKTATTNKP